MNVVNNRWVKWQYIAGVGVICGLAVTGCSRSDKNVETEVVPVDEQAAINTASPAVSCQNPMVQDRLRASLQNMIYQESQALTNRYANDAEIVIDGGAVSSKVGAIAINVQNASVLQEANANGMATCQASISTTLTSEDLYQAGQLSAATNQPSLESRLAQGNIRVNNNMLIDDAFTYVAGAQGGQVRVRIAGQPALIAIVSDIVASSVLKSTVDSQHAQVPVQQPRRPAAPQNNGNQSRPQNKPAPQPRPVAPSSPAKPAQPVKPVQPAKPVQPVKPAQPAKPTLPPTISESNKTTITRPNADNKPADVKSPVTPKAPAATPSAPVKSVPKDDSIDMVIIEDNNATY